MKHRSGILLFLLNWLWSQMCKVLNEYRAKCCKLSLNGCNEPFKQHAVAEVLYLISLVLTKNNHFTWHNKGLRFLTAHDCFPPLPDFAVFAAGWKFTSHQTLAGVVMDCFGLLESSISSLLEFCSAGQSPNPPLQISRLDVLIPASSIRT